MNRPKVSIIIPVYNAEATLSRCLSSILEQSFKSLEILVIDDGSTDGSAKICDEFAQKDKRIRVFHKKNGGVSTARNVGLEQAQGEWLTFIDSDDFVEPNYFPFENLHNSDLLLQNWKFSDTEQFAEFFEAKIYSQEEFKTMVDQNVHLDIFRMVAAKFLKKELVDQLNLRFDTCIKLGEDTLFMLTYLSHCHSLEVLRTSIYRYYRATDWHIHKHYISHQDFCYYIDSFWSLYKKSGFNSPKLLGFIYNFFFWRSNPEGSLWQTIKINSYPSVIEMKHEEGCTTNTEKAKYILFRVLSKIVTIKTTH